jgi:hypothetical protein
MNYRTLTLALTLCTIASLTLTPPSTAENAQPGGAGKSAPPASGLVDDNAPGWIWRGMDEIADSGYTGGTAHAGGASAYCAYTFQGTGIQVFGLGGETVSAGSRTHKLGKAVISIDGKVVSTVSLQRDSSQYGLSLAQITGLSNGNHVLEVTSSGGWIVVDYVNVVSPNSAAPAPAPTPGIISDGDYRLRPRHAPDKCLDVATIAVDGVAVGINHVDDNRPQIWHVKSLGGGRYEVSSVAAPSLALTMVPPSQADGAPTAHLYNYIADPAQQLTIAPVDNSGYYKIAPSSNSGVVLDVLKLAATDGTPTITYGWWGANNQQWTFEPIK